MQTAWPQSVRGLGWIAYWSFTPPQNLATLNRELSKRHFLLKPLGHIIAKG
ncbi:stage IV sporulation protein B [Alicyclobacillus hesperidum URH17-3-68]|nr:stage IV sporulation protein B [Alicyclobacillus hesperidum URH17-3-68]